MKLIQKLVRNGNSTQITIPRFVLAQLGWLPGQMLIVEVFEDKRVLLREPQDGEFAPKNQGPVLLSRLPEVKA